MPIKDATRRKEYFRSYMRNRRKHSGVNLEGKSMLNPDSIDWDAPFTVEERYPYPAWLVQHGRWYDPYTGRYVGPEA